MSLESSFAQKFFENNYKHVVTEKTEYLKASLKDQLEVSLPSGPITQRQLLNEMCVALVVGNVSYFKKGLGEVRPYYGDTYITKTPDGRVESEIKCDGLGFEVWNPQRPDGKYFLTYEKASKQYTLPDGSPLPPDYEGSVSRNGTGLICPIDATNLRKDAMHEKVPSWGKECSDCAMNDYLVVSCMNPDEGYCCPSIDIENGSTILTGTAHAENAHVTINSAYNSIFSSPAPWFGKLRE